MFATAQETAPADGTFTLTIPEEGLALDVLLARAGAVTGRTFLFADQSQTKGKVVRMLGTVRVPQNEAFDLYQSILVTQGFALSPLGQDSRRVYLVENIEQAKFLKQRAPFVHENNLVNFRNQVGTVIMTTLSMRWIKVANVRGAVTQIMGARSAEFAQEVESANSLIVVGFAPTIFAVAQIVHAMDVPDADAIQGVDLVPLQFAVAEELEPILKDLITGESSSGGASGASGAPSLLNRSRGLPGQPPGQVNARPAPKIIAEPRTNSIVLYATPPDIAEIKRLIAQFDVEVKDPVSNIHIYRLKNSDAARTADVLRELLGQSGSGSRGGRSLGTQARGGSRGSAGGASGAGEQLQDARVVAERHNNALLVVASPLQWERLEALIKQLDQRRPQVLIQTAIADLSSNDLRNMGVEIEALQGGDGLRFGALTGFGLSATTISNSVLGGGNPATGPGSGTGTGGGAGSGGGTGSGGGSGGGGTSTGRPGLVRVPFAAGNSINLNGGIFGIFNDNLNVPLLISLLKQTSSGNLISTPAVLTNDNEESRIESSRFVGTTSQQTTRGGTDNQSFDGYQEAKIELIVSPHVSNDSYVRLEIEVTVEAFVTSAESRPSTVPPNKTRRHLVGSVTCPNGRTVLIGGLTKLDDAEQQQAVPFLDQIPILGELFKNTSHSMDRQTLHVFLTPTIVDDFSKIEEVSTEKKLEMLKLQGQLRLVDPEFRPILLNDPDLPIATIEATSGLDVPRYASLGGPAPAPPAPQDPKPTGPESEATKPPSPKPGERRE